MPEHFKPANATRADYRPPDPNHLQASARAWCARHGFGPAGADPVRIHLLVIDDQIDFSFPQGAL